MSVSMKRDEYHIFMSQLSLQSKLNPIFLSVFL